MLFSSHHVRNPKGSFRGLLFKKWFNGGETCVLQDSELREIATARKAKYHFHTLPPVVSFSSGGHFTPPLSKVKLSFS